MIKESASMEMTRLAKEYAREGHKVYTLSIGDTHFKLPETIQQKLSVSLHNGKTHYVESLGIKELRDSISENDYSKDYNSEEILIVPGVKQGLYYFLNAFEVKTVCILEPAWLGYHAICNMCNKEINSINIKEADWVQKLSNTNFDCLIICMPNNPDGKIFGKEEMEFIYNVVKSKNALLLIDEIYSLYSFNNNVKEILKPYYKERNVVTFSGFSKGYAATGLRIGYVASHDEVMIKKMNILQQNIATCVNSISQYAFINYNDSALEVSRFVDYYKSNRDLICKIFPDLEIFKPDGGFYYFINLEKFGIHDGEKFCKELLFDSKIALVPGTAYGKGFETWVRLSYSIDATELTEAIEKLKKYITTYSNGK